MNYLICLGCVGLILTAIGLIFAKLERKPQKVFVVRDYAGVCGIFSNRAKAEAARLIYIDKEVTMWREEVPHAEEARPEYWVGKFTIREVEVDKI